MDESLSSWLRLREAADWTARSEMLTAAVAAAMPPGDPVRVLDLATGTGSNVRYLASRLPGRQQWLVVDRDERLLEEVPARMSAWGAEVGHRVESTASGCLVLGPGLECRVETRQINLDVLDVAEIFVDRHLVTASALLDLVSEGWLRALAAHCRRVGAAALFALTYDGRSSCSPSEPEDEMVRGLMNGHQKRDKGLGGPAEGPGAVECAARCFAEAGYVVRREQSNWVLGPGQQELQRQLVDGWAEAALEMAPDLEPAIARWGGRRQHHIQAGRSRIVVGHDDLAAWLPGE